MDKDPFKEYLKELEPDQSHKGYVWSTAIGLQAVDGLKPSKYLIDTAIQNIEGNITLKEARKLIDNYYEEKPNSSDSERTEEADKVSARIAEILSETAFSFSPNEYLGIHRRLFEGIYKHAGKIRDYNITKKEWVLSGETVILYMEVLPNFELLLNTIFLRKKPFTIADLQWTISFTILQYLSQDCGKFMFLEKAIPEQRLSSLSNI